MGRMEVKAQELPARPPVEGAGISRRSIFSWTSRAHRAMHPLNIKATRADRANADFIASHTQPPVEQATRLVTYGADEKILLAVVGAAWLYAAAAQPRLRPAAAHFFAVSLASAVLPHLLKI